MSGLVGEAVVGGILVPRSTFSGAVIGAVSKFFASDSTYGYDTWGAMLRASTNAQCCEVT